MAPLSTPPPTLSLFRTFLRFFFRHLYTSLAWSYDAVAWLSSAGQWDSWRATALRWLPAQGMILELGPGTGHLLESLRRQGRPTVGLEASRQMARLARRRLAGAGIPSSVVRAVAQAQPFPSEAFEAVVSTFPSEYILEQETLFEIGRTLRPGGRLVIVAAGWPTSRAWLDRMGNWLYRITGQTLLPDSAWVKSLASSPFNLEVETVTLPRGLVIVVHGNAPASRAGGAAPPPGLPPP